MSTLDGSISREFSLDFDTVTVARDGCLLTVDYVKNYGRLSYTPCHLEIKTDDLGLHNGATVTGQSFFDDVTVTSRSPTGRSLPDVESGTLSFSEFSMKPGDRVTGDLAVTFIDADGNMRGHFSGNLVDNAPNQTCDAYDAY